MVSEKALKGLMDESAPGLHHRGEAAPPRPRLTSVSEAGHRRPIIVLLGMHRSGTSLCSNILSILGADMADDATPGRDNARGHWERWEIVKFHDRILETFNRVYLGPFHDFPLPSGWWADPKVSQIRQEIVAFLNARMADAPFGFKDPRTIRLLPLWRQIFAEMRLSPRFVLCLRNPAEVARSLHARDGLDPMVGEYRWLVHMLDFFRYVGDSEFCVIEYENWFRQPAASLNLLHAHLNLDPIFGRDELDHAVFGIIDREMRHDGPQGLEASVPLVRHVYQLARSSGVDAGARAQAQELASQFVAFDLLHHWFYRQFETVSAVADKVAAAEGEVANLRSAAAEATDALAAANARAATAEADLVRLRPDAEARERVEETLGQLRSEHDATLAHAAELESRVGVTGTQLAGIISERDEIAEMLLQVRAEVAAGHARIAEIEAERDVSVGRAVASEEAAARACAEAAAVAVARVEAEKRRDSLARQVTALEEALTCSRAAADSSAARLGEIMTERDAAVARAEMADRRLLEASAETDEAATCAAAMKAEYELAANRASVAEKMLADARTETEAARGHLARIEAERAEVQARLAAREGDLADLAQTASRHAAAAEHLESELESARQVGAAMLAALRSSPPPLPLAPRETWLSLLRRRVGLRAIRSARTGQ